jgi:hypothetical protein
MLRWHCKCLTLYVHIFALDYTKAPRWKNLVAGTGVGPSCWSQLGRWVQHKKICPTIHPWSLDDSPPTLNIKEAKKRDVWRPGLGESVKMTCLIPKRTYNWDIILTDLWAFMMSSSELWRSPGQRHTSTTSPPHPRSMPQTLTAAAEGCPFRETVISGGNRGGEAPF